MRSSAAEDGLVIGKNKGGRDAEGGRSWRVELSGHWMDAVDKGRRCGNPMRRSPERWKRGIGEWRGRREADGRFGDRREVWLARRLRGADGKQFPQ
jgi:hypothetical protein